MSVRISIVTPTLNAARYLPTCLASVRSQDYDNLEHIVIDGGSTDETAQLASAVDLVVQPGANQSQAINVGFRRASGEVLAWLNADDRYVPGALKIVGERFENDASLDVLYGDCDVIDEQGRFLWRVHPGAYEFRRLLRYGNYLAQPSVFMRRQVLQTVGYLDETFEYGMDYEYWLRLGGCRVDYVPAVLSEFCWRPDSKTSAAQFGNWRELLRAVRRHGGGWTLPLVYSFSCMLITIARQRLVNRVALARLQASANRPGP